MHFAINRQKGGDTAALLPFRRKGGSFPLTAPSTGRSSGSAPEVSLPERKTLWQERAAHRMLMLFIALLYITPGILYPQLEDIPIAKGVAALSFAFLFLAKVSRKESWHLSDKTTLWLIAFTLVEGLSVVDALWREYSLFEFLDALKLLMVYLLIVNMVDDFEKVRRILWIMVAAALVPALGAIYHYLFKIDLIEGYRAAWIGVYADPNDLAYNLVVLIPISLALFASETKPILKGALLSSLAVFAAAIYVTFSRGGLVGLFVILFFQVLRSHRRLLNFSIGAVFFLALLALAPASYWERAQTILTFQKDESAMGRVYAWRAGVSMLRDRPLLGVGVGSFVMGWPIYAPPEAGTKWRAPHNTFIQVMGENGLLGSVAFLAFLATALRGLQRFGRTERPAALLRLGPPGPGRPVSSGSGAERGNRWSLPSRSGSKRGEADHYARGLEIALWGFLACSLTLGIARSWPLYLFIGLAVALQRSLLLSRGRDRGE